MKAKPTYEELERRVHELKTENTLLENKLLEASSFTEEVMTYMTEGFVLADTRGTVIFINQRLSEMLGYLPEEITGKCWLDMVSIELQAIAREEEDRRAHGHVSRYEIVLRRKTGENFPVLICAGPRFDKQSGQYIGSMAVVNDITERKRVEDDLRESEMRHRLLFQEALNPILLVDENGCYIDANEAALQFMECDRQNLMGRSVWEFAPPGQIQRQQREHAPFLDRRTLETDYLIQGHLKTLLLNVVPMEVKGRTVLWGIGQDITERKRAEEALYASESYQRQILQTSVDGFWVLDSNGSLVEVNDAYCIISGYSRSELMGMSINDLDAEEQLEETRQRLERIIRNGSEIFETMHRRKDGGIFPVEISTSYLKERGGQFVCFCRDLTQRKQDEKALRESFTRYDELIANVPAGVYILLSRTNGYSEFEYVSNRWCEIHQVKREDALADVASVNSKAHPDEKNDFLVRNQESFRNRIPFVWEGRFLIDDGNFRWLRLESTPVVLESGDTRWFGVTMDITGHKQAEEALKRKHAMLTRTEAVAHVGSWEWEAEGDKVTWSDELFRIYGLEPAEEAPSFAEHQGFFVPKDRARLVQAVEQCLKSGVPYHLELRITRRDGELRHCVVQGFPERDADNVVKRLYGSMHDITGIRRAEERIATLSHMLDDAPASITIHDTDGRFVFANAATLSLHGYDSVDEFLKINLHELDVPESEALLAQRFRKIAEEGEARFEVDHYRKDGSTFTLAVLAKRIEWQGKPAVLSIASDISDLKQAEEALRAAERRNQSLLDHSPACHMIVDLDFNLQYMSKNGFRILKLDESADVYGKPYPFEFFFPSFQQQMRDCLRQVKTTGKPMTLEALANDIEGNKIWLYSVLVPVRDDGGNLDHITVVSSDLTNEKRLENEYRQAQKMESVGRLAGGVAHDFNNMLGVILGHTEMVLDEIDPSTPLYSNLQAVQQAAERSADLTRQLLAFARKQTITPKVIDLNKTVEAMLKMLLRLIGEDIDLLWQPGSNLRPVKIDPAQIDQILVNLCVNARDASAGKGKIIIETNTRIFDDAYCTDHLGFLPGEYVLLAVSDNGCGMDKKTLDQIFEPFFTTKKQGEGTGLGLASVFGMVKQNNGFINVYSEPGQGTTFKIYLPVYARKSAEVVEKAPNLPAEQGNGTILLVEDEAAILEMTTMMLTRLGYTVVAAATPGEAIRLAHEYQGRIDLLMTDVVMPEMNGRELAGNLLSHYPDLKRLFMSGYTANVIAHHGVLDQGVHFIQKPFSKKDLGAKLREVLEG